MDQPLFKLLDALNLSETKNGGSSCRGGSNAVGLLEVLMTYVHDVYVIPVEYKLTLMFS